jgi:hypothetical protein
MLLFYAYLLFLGSRCIISQREEEFLCKIALINTFKKTLGKPNWDQKKNSVWKVKKISCCMGRILLKD